FKNLMNKKLFLLTTSLASFLIPFTTNLISFTIPQIGKTYDVSFMLVVWVPLSFLISLTSFMIIFGKLSDIYGKVLFFRIGFVLFVLPVFLIPFAYNIYFLISLVLVMGAGAALFGTNTVAIISQVIPKEKRGSALGINSMSVYTGLVTSILLGSALLDLIGWKYIFLIDIPIALTGLFISFISMKGFEIKNRMTGIDAPGSITFTLSLLLFVVYISSSEIYTWQSTWYLLIMAVIIMLVFIYIESRSKNPFLDLSLFRDINFSAASLSLFFNYISTYYIVFVFTIYMSIFLKFSTMETGMVLIAQPVLMATISPISGRLADRYGSKELSSVGMATISTAFFLLYFLNMSSPVIIVIPIIMIGLGFGVFSAPNTNSAMYSVEKNKLGIASGTLGTIRYTGQLLSIAIASLILSSSMPRAMLLQMFAGIYTGNTVYKQAFLSGFKEVMLLSAILTLTGSFISLLKSRERL
ncbi:MAG: MFS transporter, partial [Thermoplasmata archaeon]